MVAEPSVRKLKRKSPLLFARVATGHQRKLVRCFRCSMAQTAAPSLVNSHHMRVRIAVRNPGSCLKSANGYTLCTGCSRAPSRRRAALASARRKRLPEYQ